MRTNRKQLIYVVDDDVPLNNLLCAFLKKHGFINVKEFYTGEELLNEMSAHANPIIIQDFDLPDMTGIDILKKVKSENSAAEFIFLSGQSTIEVAVEAIRFGAFDYIIKDNFAKENVLNKINNVLKIKNLLKTRRNLIYGLIGFALFLLLTFLFLFQIKKFS
jgi:DNA-binding NtrC family response regulator